MACLRLALHFQRALSLFPLRVSPPCCHEIHTDTHWISSVIVFGGSFCSSFLWRCSFQLPQSQDSLQFFLLRILNSPCVMPAHFLWCELSHLPSQPIALSSSAKIFPHVPHFSLLLFPFVGGISDPFFCSVWEWVSCLMSLTSMVSHVFVCLVSARFALYPSLLCFLCLLSLLLPCAFVDTTSPLTAS